MMMRISFYNFETILQGKGETIWPSLLASTFCVWLQNTKCWDFQAAVKLAGPDVSLERGSLCMLRSRVVVSRQVDRKGKVPETVLEQNRDLRGIPWIRQGSAVVLGKRSR